MLLVEKHIIKKGNQSYKTLDNLCFLSKNLYNYANYIVRQEFIKTSKEKEEGKAEGANYLNYNAINRLLIDQKQVDYIALPRKVSNQILMLLDKNWKSFFKSIKDWSKNKSKYKGRPSLPKYKHKTKGRNILTYELGAISTQYKKTGIISLSGIPDFEVPFINKKHKLKCVRIVPTCLDTIVVEIIYDNGLGLKKERKKENEKITNDKNCSAIDLGVSNLMTLTSNLKRQQPVIINGRPLKSMNQYYNKKLAIAKSELPKNIYTSSKIKRLTNKRNNKINDYLHRSSTYVTNKLVDNNMKFLIVGKNDGWKHEVNIGDKNNQNFVQIPFNKLIDMLTYKCEMNNIEVVLKNESHTSKCSFIDNEGVKHQEKYMGRRKSRGLFKSKNGNIINADVNGSYNILRKEVSEFKYVIEDVAVHPIRVNIDFNQKVRINENFL